MFVVHLSIQRQSSKASRVSLTGYYYPLTGNASYNADVAISPLFTQKALVSFTMTFQHLITSKTSLSTIISRYRPWRLQQLSKLPNSATAFFPSFPPYTTSSSHPHLHMACSHRETDRTVRLTSQLGLTKVRVDPEIPVVLQSISTGLDSTTVVTVHSTFSLQRTSCALPYFPTIEAVCSSLLPSLVCTSSVYYLRRVQVFKNSKVRRDK